LAVVTAELLESVQENVEANEIKENWKMIAESAWK